jgi:AmmeMemoRadiSam system protein B
MPAVLDSWEIGRIISRTVQSLGLSCVAISSSDLTHYGPNFGFEPHGRGMQALDWVRSVNDRRFLDAVIEGDPKMTLNCALKDQSACSPGAVIAGMGFATECKAHNAKLLEYATSADSRPASSFVGYGSISWEP